MSIMLPPAIAQARANPAPFRQTLGIQPSRIQCTDRCIHTNAALSTDTDGVMVSIDIDFSPQADWADLVFRWGNFGVNQDDGPNDITIRAALQLPDGTRHPIWWPNGQRDVLLTPGAVVDSLPLPVFIPAGTSGCRLRYYLTTPAGGKWSCAFAYSAATAGRDGAAWYETPGTDKTLVGTVTNFAFDRILPLPPLAIIGKPSTRMSLVAGQTTKPVVGVGIIGDSIAAASGDTNNLTTGYIGYPMRAIAASYGWAQMAYNGRTLNEFAQSANTRRRFHGLVGVTHVICDLGINDIWPGAYSLATIQANYAALNAQLVARGIKLIPCTVTPITDAANSGGLFSSSPAGQKQVVQDFNNWLLTTNPFGNGVVDAAAAARASETGAGYFAWRSDLGTPTVDGIHPASAIHIAMAAVLAAALPSVLV